MKRRIDISARHDDDCILERRKLARQAMPPAPTAPPGSTDQAMPLPGETHRVGSFGVADRTAPSRCRSRKMPKVIGDTRGV